MEFSLEEAFELLIEFILVSGLICTVFYFYLNVEKYL